MIDYHIHSYFSDGDQTIEEIISTAVRRNLTAIAITDHCDINGKFIYLPSTSPPHPIKDYILEIRSASRNSILKIYLGIEISIFSSFENVKCPIEFNSMDFILIETFPARTPHIVKFDPLKYAIQLKENVQIPVGLAHPTLTYIENNFKTIEKNDIFIELNSDKLIPKPNEKEKIFNQLAKIIISSKIKISIGSDAHIIFSIGGVKDIWNFLMENEFQDRLILPP